ncbi:MAG: VWA domain-containing protein [Methanomassiliicoccus sp.]|nr:VWA domain-containing protein [Methanomassiliicoccus sp.]
MTEAGGVRWRKAVNDDSVRLVTGRPRRLPRKKREEIAAILAQELLGTREVVDVRRHAGRYGSFHVILRALRPTEEWGRLRDMAARSDIIAALSLRHAIGAVLDILDRTTPLPAGTPAEQSLNGLIALTQVAWQRGASVSVDNLARAVEEFDAADERGEARDVLVQALHARLAGVVEEMQHYMEMLAMMKQMLPSGDDETFIEEVFLEYMRNIDRMNALLKRSRDIQQVIDLMGKLDVEYGAHQDRAKSFAPSEAYDLGLSSDLRHVLPVELLKLKVPILRVLFFSQLLEGNLLTYELRGLNWNDAPEKRKKGPIIALIDASGSMGGQPELIAKAFILMLAKRMEREGRDIKVILFAASDWKLEINLADKMKVAKSLLDTMCLSFEGYTDFNSALRLGLEAVKGDKWNGADVLFFTDGESKVSDEGLVREWNDFKKRTSSRIFTLIVNNVNAGGLEKVSDKIWTLPTGTWDVEGSPSSIIKLVARG